MHRKTSERRMGNILFCISLSCIMFLVGHAHFTRFKKPVQTGRYIRPKPKDEFILSLSRGELWYVSPNHEACFHITIKVPPLEVESLKIYAQIGVTKFGKTNRLRQNHCLWIDHTKIRNVTEEDIEFVGCSWYLDRRIKSTGSVFMSGTLNIKMKHRGSQHWSREQHTLPQTTERFVGVIDRKLDNLCSNETYRKYCPFFCGIYCIDVLTGQDRLFCDTKWGTSNDVQFLGTGSPNYDPLYVAHLDEDVEQMRNGSLVILTVSTETPKTTGMSTEELDAKGHDILFSAHQNGGGDKRDSNHFLILSSIITSLAFSISFA